MLYMLTNQPQFVFKEFFFRSLLGLVGGAFYASGFPVLLPFSADSGQTMSFPLGTLVGFFLLLVAFRKNGLQTGRDTLFAITLIAFFCLGLYLAGFYWLPFTIKEFGGIPSPFNHLLGVLFSLLLLPQYYLFLFLIKLLQKLSNKNIAFFSSIFSSLKPKQSIRTYLLAPLLALLVTFCEIYTPQQFPAHMGHPWMSLAPYLGLAPIIGASGFSFFNYLLCFDLFLSLKDSKFHFHYPIIFLIFLLSNFLFPLHNDQEGQKINIRLVQPNIGNNLKISSEEGSEYSIKTVFEKFENWSLTDIDGRSTDLIVWPETAYPLLLNSRLMQFSDNNIPELIRRVVKKSKTALFFGGYDYNNAKGFGEFFESEFNTAFLVNLDEKFRLNWYHKIKLIPFGEGLPFGPFNQLLSGVIQNISYFARGHEYSLFSLASGPSFFSAICYEVLFPGFIRDYINALDSRPSFLINLTNDSWYGNTSEPYQHLFLSKWRAVELNIPLVRSTNTGISLVIFPNGLESQRLGIGEANKIDLTIPITKSSATFYQRFGEWPLWLLFFLLIFLLLLFRVRTRSS